MSERNFQVIPGGLSSETAQLAHLEPLSFTLCALARIVDQRTDTKIVQKLCEINMFFQHLPGKIVGILDDSSCAVCDSDCVGHERPIAVRMPTTQVQTTAALMFEAELLTEIVPVAIAFPFLKTSAEQTRKALEACLRADVIVDLHAALVREPGAAPPALKRQARLEELAKETGPILCNICEEPIIRSAFNSPKCKYFGPLIRVCEICERHTPKLLRRTTGRRS